jgi:hypothetical protein
LVDPSHSGNGSSSSSSSSMPVRHAPTRPHLQLSTHPYRRPQSASSGSGVRRERQHVRFASTGGGQVAAGTIFCPNRKVRESFFHSAISFGRHNGVLVLVVRR